MAQTVPLPSGIGERVRVFRMLKRWSQKRLAHEAAAFGGRIDRFDVSRIENGQQPDLLGALALAAAFGVPVADLDVRIEDYPEAALLIELGLDPSRVPERPSSSPARWYVDSAPDLRVPAKVLDFVARRNSRAR